MIESRSSVQLAMHLMELTKEYLFKIQSDDDWFLEYENYSNQQAQCIEQLIKLKNDSFDLGEKDKLESIMHKCYQMEVQINAEIKRQHSIVAKELSHIRKGNRLKNTYDLNGYGSGIMLDTYK